MSHAIFAPRQLDGLGRCCGRKPTVYKRPQHYLFCGRCTRYYDHGTGEQIESWAYKVQPDGTFRYLGYSLCSDLERQCLGEPLAVLDDVGADDGRAA